MTGERPDQWGHCSEYSTVGEEGVLKYQLPSPILVRFWYLM